jgi:hypothetical protein
MKNKLISTMNFPCGEERNDGEIPCRKIKREETKIKIQKLFLGSFKG